MNNSFEITNISVNVTAKSSGKRIVLIRLANGKAIVRDTKPFLTDLRESHLISADITDINDRRLLSVFRSLVGGKVSGNIQWHKVGDTYVANEYSKEVRNGVAKIGDVLRYEKEGYRVEGFVVLEPSVQKQQIAANAEAYAMLFGSVSAAVDSIIGSAIDENAGEDDDDNGNGAAAVTKVPVRSRKS